MPKESPWVDNTLFPKEWESPAYWEEVIMLAFAEALLRRMDRGKVEPLIAWE